MAPGSTVKRVLTLSGIVIGAVFALYLCFSAWGHRTSILRFFQGSEYKVNIPGKVYLSLVPDNGVAPSGIYTYEFATGSLERVLVDINSSLPSYSINTSPTLSSDGSVLAFVRRGNTETLPQIYTASSDGTGVRQITASPEMFKRGPVVSPTKELIAFSASSKVENGSEIEGFPDDWGVYLADASGSTWRVATGTNPLFSPDGQKLLVLRNNGFHLFDIHDAQNPADSGLALRPTETNGYVWTKAALSKDGSHIVWVVPSEGKVFVAKINSWETFSIAPKKAISVSAYQAVFSPNGKQLVLEEVRPSQTRLGNTRIILSVYDLDSGQLTDAVDLYKYRNAFIRLGGWAE